MDINTDDACSLRSHSNSSFLRRFLLRLYDDEVELNMIETSPGAKFPTGKSAFTQTSSMSSRINLTTNTANSLFIHRSLFFYTSVSDNMSMC